MLRELRIQNIAIIEDVVVRLGPGLNVLSGETGAGKSIILGALGLILGARASADLVRTGKPQAEVVATFDRDEPVEYVLRGLELDWDDDDDGLVVRRVVSAAGRSRAWVNGAAVPTGALRTLASVLVDYASQHEHRVLLDEARHREILDQFGDHDALLEGVTAAVEELRGHVAERDRLVAAEDDQRARLDYLAFQLQELADLAPQEGEEEELEQERIVLESAARLSELARGGERQLYSGQAAAIERLGEAERAIEELVKTDASLADTLESIREAKFAVEDAARELGAYAGRTRSDPGRLQEVDDRLAELRRLARKHRTSIDGLATLHGTLQAEHDVLSTLDVRMDEVDRAIARARVTAKERCRELTARRRVAGEALSARVEDELSSLAMARARLSVAVEPVTEGVPLDDGGPFATSTGADAVAFLLSANPGEEPRPLARVASGGELSRILLSVRRALAGTRSVQVQTCVFDEIDAGLGGTTAEAVSEKLARIAEESQVLVITHLPHIAAAGDAHFRVEKHVEEGRTRAQVRPLTGDDRVAELVRMVAGSGASDAAESFARELLGPRAVADGTPGRL